VARGAASKKGKMADTPYLHQVLVSLRRIIRATDLQSKRLVKECGLTLPQVMVLRAIEALGDVTVRCISEHVSLSQATVTTILDRLESRGLVERVRSRTDKRVVNARLTERGQDTLHSAPALLHEQFIERFEALAPHEQTQVLSALQRVARMMEAESIDPAALLHAEESR
jgi:DNA-binding MarR family transcriptional regulator